MCRMICGRHSCAGNLFQGVRYSYTARHDRPSNSRGYGGDWIMKKYVRRLLSRGLAYSTRTIVCLAFFLVACGDQPAATSTPVASSAPAGGPTTISIDATGFKFAPAEVTIPLGSTVVWTNKDAA